MNLRTYCQFMVALVALSGAWAHAQDIEQKAGDDATQILETDSDPGQLPLDELRIFTKVFDHIRQGYVEEISDKELLRYAIKGMLSELDPHSNYLDASSFNDLQMNTTGEFGGLGIEVGMENGFVKVISPIDDTPASRAGVESGDLIIKLGDKPVKGMTLNEAVELMRGPKGSELILTIVREGREQPFELPLTRDIIKVKSVRSRLIEPGYGYLRIAQFQVGTGADVREAVQQLQADSPLKGLIIDLRNNPGGVLQASVEVADTFLNEGLIVYTEGRIKDADVRYSATEGDELNGLPIVVLINGGSASASEIVAGALQDQHRAVLVGTDSFGKGSVQTVIPISEDRAIKLTTALYFTPSGRSIQAQGITPDIVVERARVTAVKSRTGITEADLQGHLDNVRGGAERNAKQRAQEISTQLLEDDNQMFEALNLLKALHLFGEADSSKVYVDQPEDSLAE